MASLIILSEEMLYDRQTIVPKQSNKVCLMKTYKANKYKR